MSTSSVISRERGGDRQTDRQTDRERVVSFKVKVTMSFESSRGDCPVYCELLILFQSHLV